MRLDDHDDGIQVRDQRGGRFSGRSGGGGLGPLLGLLPLLLRGKMGFGTLVIVAIAGFFLYSSGGLQLGNLAGTTGQQVQTQAGTDTSSICNVDASSREMCNTLSSLDQTWESLLDGYRRPTLTFYSQSGRSGCGAAQSAMGPFYCPGDEGIYLDTAFFNELDQRMGAAGDFARRYVIAHEVGHHIQKLTGIAQQVRQQQQRASEAQGNALQVRMELQADCYAGVWAARNRDRIEAGDIEEGLTAANAIGDDTLMRSAGRRIAPESFTHGTSDQRKNWLRAGLESGDPQQCNTFAAAI